MLTDKRVQAARPPKSGVLELPDNLIGGLALRITSNDARSWAVRLRVDGEQIRKTFGYPRDRDGVPVLSLAQARQVAKDLKVAGASGKLDRAPAGTWGDLVAEYLKHAEGSQRARTYGETKRILEGKDLAAWKDRPARSITSDDVRRVRDAITERGAPISATRTLRKIGAMGTWAKSEGKLDASPAFGIKPRTKEDSRDRVLTDGEIKAFWRGCGAIGYPYGDCFRMLLLTGCRLREVAHGSWDEIDGDTWVIPGRRTKNGKPHVVHLSEPALAIIEGLPRVGDYLFSSDGANPIRSFSATKDKLDAASGISDWVLHDLRRSCCTVMAGLGVAAHVADKVLNHTAGSIKGVAAIYNRFEYMAERREALDKLGRHINGLMSHNVVPMRA